MIFFKMITNLQYLPRIVIRIRNWLSFCLHYVGLRNSDQFVVEFRNRLKIRTKGKLHVSTVAVIFVKDNYGIIADNSIVVDIGANIGAFSIFAATSSKGTTVYAYEPFNENYELLMENVLLNDLSGTIRAFRLGVAAERGVRQLYLGDTLSHSLSNAHKDSSSAIQIECISLQDVFQENSLQEVDILKLDCEGAEFEILYNTPDDVLRRVREIRMEYHNQSNPRETLSELSAFMGTKNKFPTYHKRGADGYTGNIWFK